MADSLLKSFATVEIPARDLVDQEDREFIENSIKAADDLKLNLQAWEKHIQEGISKIGDSTYKNLNDEETRRDGSKYWHIESNLAVRGNKRMNFSSAYSLKYIYETLDWINTDTIKEVHNYLTTKYQLEEEIDEDDLEKITDPWEVINILSGMINNVPFQEVAVKNICSDMSLSILGVRDQEITANKNILTINRGVRYQESFRKGLNYFQNGTLNSEYQPFLKSIFSPGETVFPDDECKIERMKTYKNSKFAIAFRSVTYLGEFVDLFRLKIKYPS